MRYVIFLLVTVMVAMTTNQLQGQVNDSSSFATSTPAYVDNSTSEYSSMSPDSWSNSTTLSSYTPLPDVRSAFTQPNMLPAQQVGTVDQLALKQRPAIITVIGVLYPENLNENSLPAERPSATMLSLVDRFDE